MKYRRDNRSPEDFKKDIKNSTEIEHQILELWLSTIEKETGIRHTYQHNGCGDDGELLNDNQVNTKADYLVEEYGLIEVKFALPFLLENFHLKQNQVKSYIKQNASVIMVNGWQEGPKEFMLITPHNLEYIQNNMPIVKWFGFGGKKSFRIPINLFTWSKLDV